jgi:hypothetical protein
MVVEGDHVDFERLGRFFGEESFVEGAVDGLSGATFDEHEGDRLRDHVLVSMVAW